MSRVAWCLLPLLMFVFAVPAQAEIWRWVDDDGVTQYSQYPPPDVDAELIDATSGIASDPEPAVEEDDAADQDTEADDDGPRTMAEFCEQIRAQLAIVESDQEVRVEIEGGQLEPLEGAAREQRREALQQQLAQHC